MQVNNILLTVTDKELLKKVQDCTFLFPLEGFCVGYEQCFNISEIKISNAYILINRILDDKDLSALENILKSIPNNISGIIFEDLGVIELVKDLDITKILWQNHLSASFLSVNGYLKYVDSVMMSTDITEEEIKLIINKAEKPLVLPVLGYTPVMYSRRHLINSFNMNYKENVSNPNTIKEEVLKDEFKIYENEFGTQLFYNKLYDGRVLMKYDALFYFINSVFISDDDVISFIKGEELSVETFDGFLNKKTIYKLKDGE